MTKPSDPFSAFFAAERNREQLREQPWRPEPEVDLGFILRVLRLMSCDNTDELWWRTDEQYAPITFFIKCSDTFAYACADLEEVTPENVGRLEQAFEDCLATGDPLADIYAPMLFVARERKQKPIPQVMRTIQDSVRPLLEAAEEAK